MYIKDMMTTRLATVLMDDNLGTIRDIFENVSFHHVLVIDEDDDQLIGMVSDRDMRHYLSPKLGTGAELQRDRDTLTQKAHQIMSRNLITLTSDQQVYDAIALFTQHRISAIPVVDADKKPVGIVSWRDIMKQIAESKSRDEFNAWI